jgi:hypothetical protein
MSLSSAGSSDESTVCVVGFGCRVDGFQLTVKLEL